MKPNDLLLSSDAGKLYRILPTQNPVCFLAIDCLHPSMPIPIPVDTLQGFSEVSMETLYTMTNKSPVPVDCLTPQQKKIALNRYTMISAPLSVVEDKVLRTQLIEKAALTYRVSKQTIRNYLIQYLIYQDIAILAPQEPKKERDLTQDQKNMRWALNKFFYTGTQNSLNEAYIQMLKAKYSNAEGQLTANYPSYYQFRYFYRKNKKISNYVISREGLKAYQRNTRPLVGDQVQSFAPSIGTCMVDSTICDIYIVDQAGKLVGRPILVAAIDANTSLCIGYSLLWEGGNYSLHNLMLNILSDKSELCSKMGISISADQWPNQNCLPGIIVTDQGSEYKGQNFEQITELGITLINLPSYRPDLKGTCEKFFDLIQSSCKSPLIGHGIVRPDFMERGAPDYRKEASLTLYDFERVIIRCIIYYNSERIIKSYPYTKEMLDAQVLPHANALWKWKAAESGANMIQVSVKDLILTMLPRTTGRFTRFGLKVNKLRYHADGFQEQYLSGGTATIAYNPNNANMVWLVQKDGRFIEFTLIESRFENMTLNTIQQIQQQQQDLIRSRMEADYKAQIDLHSFISSVTEQCPVTDTPQLTQIRKTRTVERQKAHIDLGGLLDEQ